MTITADPLASRCHHAIDIPFSFIRTVTVGSGIAPDLLTPDPACDGRTGALAGSHPDRVITAGGDLHPALRTFAADTFQRQTGLIGFRGVGQAMPPRS